MSKKPAPCMEPGCERKKYGSYHRCLFHWLERQPIEKQVEIAQWRLGRAQSKPGFEHRSRVPKDEWPAGRRWCAGCQYFVPLHYTRGSRCRACASQASHASHVQRKYELPPELYQALLAWQGGVCYVCGKVPRGRRLAVDHDHHQAVLDGHDADTGCPRCVRGLLCASDDWGCNKTLAIALNDVAVAQRLLAYVQKPPLQRLQAGEPPRSQ